MVENITAEMSNLAASSVSGRIFMLIRSTGTNLSKSLLKLSSRICFKFLPYHSIILIIYMPSSISQQRHLASKPVLLGPVKLKLIVNFKLFAG